MTAKQYPHQQQSAQKKGSWFFSLALGISLLISLGNIPVAVNLLNQQQLISLPTDIFPSDEYQPIYPGSRERIANYDFSQIDRLAKEINYSGSSVAELASLLDRHASTDTEKARIIYAWIAQHIAYDVPAFMDAVNRDRYPDVSPAQVLRQRATICSGYSNLYQVLAEAMGLNSVIVVGYAKGATPKESRFENVNHAWNAVQLEDGWYLLDATWGAGSVQNNQFKPNFQPYYFATAPQELINHHFPQDQGWQLLSRAHSRAEFDNLPNIAARFYNLGLSLVEHHNYQINASGRVEIRLQAPRDVVAIANLHQETQELPSSTVFVSRRDDNLVVSVAPPETGLYDLKIYAKKQDNPGNYDEIINYQIAADGSAASLPTIYGHFNQYQATLFEPLTAELKPNWSTYFNLHVPQAIDVQVVNLESEHWNSLDRVDDYFSGRVDITTGKTVVVGKFPGDDRYWQLVEYQSH